MIVVAISELFRHALCCQVLRLDFTVCALQSSVLVVDGFAQITLSWSSVGGIYGNEPNSDPGQFLQEFSPRGEWHFK